MMGLRYYLSISSFAFAALSSCSSVPISSSPYWQERVGVVADGLESVACASDVDLVDAKVAAEHRALYLLSHELDSSLQLGVDVFPVEYDNARYDSKAEVCVRLSANNLSGR